MQLDAITAISLRYRKVSVKKKGIAGIEEKYFFWHKLLIEKDELEIGTQQISL